MTAAFPCPCCGYLTLGEPPPGTFSICPVCHWEDDRVQYDDPSYQGGANGSSLNEAKTNFQELEKSIRSLLSQGNKIEAIRIHRQHVGLGLFESKTAVELIERGESLPDTEVGADDLEKQILELMAAGQKIAAIKLHRERTHAGLKESKDAVEALVARHGVAAPGTSGCFGVLLLMMFGVLMVVGWILVVQK